MLFGFPCFPTKSCFPVWGFALGIHGRGLDKCVHRRGASSTPCSIRHSKKIGSALLSRDENACASFLRYPPSHRYWRYTRSFVRVLTMMALPARHPLLRADARNSSHSPCLSAVLLLDLQPDCRDGFCFWFATGRGDCFCSAAPGFVIR